MTHLFLFLAFFGQTFRGKLQGSIYKIHYFYNFTIYIRDSARRDLNNLKQVTLKSFESHNWSGSITVKLLIRSDKLVRRKITRFSRM